MGATLAARVGAISLVAIAPACLSLGSGDENRKPDAGTGGSVASIDGGGGFPTTGGSGGSAGGGGSFASGGSSASGGSGASGGTPGGGGGSCSPTTCAAQNVNCGALDDGCGTTIDCGTCPTGQACNGVGQCVGIDGAWSANYSKCDGVQNPADPTLSIVWTISQGSLVEVISDADCSITDLGSFTYTATTFNLTFTGRLCSPEGCAVGQGNSICNSTSSAGGGLAGTYTLPDAAHLVIQYPGASGLACASGQTAAVYFSH